MELVAVNSTVLIEVLNELTSCSWYTFKALPLNEKVADVKKHYESFVIYFADKKLKPVICSKVSKSSYSKYGKHYRVY